MLIAQFVFLYSMRNSKQTFRAGPAFNFWKQIKPIQTLGLKGQSHEKVGEMSVWGISLGPN
jgi:hypothetical protein